MKLSAILPFLCCLATVIPSYANTRQAEGWATCSSIYTSDDFEMTGGGDGSLIVLRSDGSDMRTTILDAIMTHDVIVFDGSRGAFDMSASISLPTVKNRTFVGVNGATFRTMWSVSQEIRHLLDSLDVKSLSSNPIDSLGGNLSNGTYVHEQCERAVRQALIDFYDDQTEPYRNSGVFRMNGCSNIIIRNLAFDGPGCIDLGAADLITLDGCDHIWIDHCRFTDGMDGNVDIINNCDFITVSDSHFRYTEKAYNHPLSNLTGGTELTDGSPQKNNISWIRCFWDAGCGGRMPWTGLGIHHLLNCYWDCIGGCSIDAHSLSKLLIENCYFTNRVGKALAIRDNNVLVDCRKTIWAGKTPPITNATVNVPYSYDVMDVLSVPGIAKTVGPTLENAYTRELAASPEVIDLGRIYAGCDVEAGFNISAFGSNIPRSVTLTAPEGVQLTINPDSGYSRSITIDADDENLLQSDVRLRACLRGAGNIELNIEANAGGKVFDIPVRANVVGLTGDGRAVTIHWPFDREDSSNVNIAPAQEDAFSKVSISMGEKISHHSTRTINNKIFTYFNSTEDISKVYDEECCIRFDVVTAAGYALVPKKVTFDAARVATNMCLINLVSSRETVDSQTLLDTFQPVRSSDEPYYSHLEIPIGNAGVGNTMTLRLLLYNMTANKQLALSDFKIEGELYLLAENGIEQIMPSPTPDTEVYYDLTGLPVIHPEPGHIYLHIPASSTPRLTICR